MKTAKLILTLKSAATFGRGDGVAGLVDREVEHDEWGMPFLRGKTLKGLLAEEAENIVFALSNASPWSDCKKRLFGDGGSSLAENETGTMHVGDATLPRHLHANIRHQVETNVFDKEAVLQSWTAIRRQTAVNEFGAPARASLRAMRVVLRDTRLEAELHFSADPIEEDWALLVAAVMAFRRAGTGRNRGRGRLKAELENENFMKQKFDYFKASLMGQEQSA